MKYPIICLLAAGLLAANTSCHKSTVSSHRHTVVVTTPTVETSGSRIVSLPAVVQEGQNVKAAFKAAGQLQSISVKEGQRVTKGQLLATLDSKDYQLGVEAAQAQYDQLKNEVARIRQLYERGSVSANEYEKALSGLEQLRVQLQTRKNQVDYTRLYSPCSGYVEEVYFNPGEMLDAGTPLLSLINTAEMQVEAALPADLYNSRMRDFKAVIGDAAYTVSLLSISPKTGSTQMYRMLLALPANASLAQASGKNAELQFVAGDDDKACASVLSIPEGAIVYRGAQPCVWVVNADSIVTSTPVTLGSITPSGEVVIVQGLTGNETIVKAGAAHLADGEKVNVAPRQSATNPGGLL